MFAPYPPDSALDDARSTARAELVSLVGAHGDNIPLDEAFAWLCAEERGESTIEPLLAGIDEIADGLFLPEDINTFEAIARINHHLFNDWGFRGDRTDYDEPDNSMLDSILKRRLGLPISLSLVYIEVAKRKGIAVRGVGFPTHFIVSPADTTPRFFVDPFNEGRVIRADQMQPWFDRISNQTHGRLPPLSWWLKPANARQIMVRVNNNLKASFMRRNELSNALRCVERLLVLTPDALDVRRDRGLLRLELGLEEEGAQDLDIYLAARHERPLTD
jgi:regulator of sirC expression with transglutaminase-like and TPR domain